MPVEAGAGQASLPELVADRARLDPGAVALVSDQAAVSYAELDELVRGLAAELAGRGIGAETPVGVCLHRGIWSVVAPLAIWLVGGCYVPLDPRYPQPRLRFMAADAGLSLIITDPDTAEVATALAAGVDADWMLAEAARPWEPASCPAGPANLAYIIYTSGSTGTPKGVAVTRGELAAHVLTVRDRFGITAADRVLAFASFCFDASLEEFLPALISGGEVVIRPSELWTPAQLASEIRERQLTVLNLPPLVLTELTAALEPGSMRSLRLLIVGDDIAPAAALARWRELVPWTAVLNAYGPTEATVTTSVYEIAGPVPGRVPIGRPLRGRRVYVLDPVGQPLPPGVPGELFVGGAGIARGYLGLPGLTAERFVPDPFAGGGARMYRTGDRARWLPDRNLEFLGRIDGQVKVRGFRVEPAEIEGVLTTHPGVGSAAVTVREDRPGDQRLVGYVVPATGGGIDSLLLRSWCARTLPPHMVPSSFVLLDALPLTSSGKVDRRALPEPQQDRAAAGVAFAAPDDGVEAIVADVWAEVLGLDRIGRHDGFFDLGGHSMLATMAAARLSLYLGLDVPVRLIFMTPTVASFTLALGKRDGIPGAPPVTPRDPAVTAIPLSFAQLRMWLLANLQPDSNEYVVPAAFRVHGPLDVLALQESLADLAVRHEILRTRIATGPDAEPVQVIGDPAGRATVSVRLLDLSGIADSVERNQAGRQAMRRAVREPFDLAAGPLLRCLAIRLDDESWMLLFIFHHVVFDAWSARVFLRELGAFYGGRVSGAEVALDRLPVQYADFAVWQRTWLSGEVLTKRLEFWRRRLAGVGVLELPGDRPRPVVRSGRGAVVRARLAGDVVAGLAGVGRSCGATMFMVLLAAFEVVLGRWSGQRDMLVGTAVAGRERVETEGLIGFFVNTLVMRADLSGDPSFAGLVSRVREDVLAAFDHQDLPFERLVTELRPERGLSRNPLFQVFFSYQEVAREESVLGPVTATPMPVELGTAKFDLSWQVTKKDTEITGAFSYSTDLFDEQTIVRLAGHVRRVLEQVAANPDVTISDLDLLDDAERSWLRELSAGPVTENPGRLFHEMFSELAATGPAAVAVQHERGDLAYGELDRRANRLAQQIRALGAGPESVVAICARPGPGIALGVLGVLKAGAAYLPLDPDHPADRLGYLLADSAAAVLLTEQGLSAGGPGHVPVIWLDQELSRPPDPCDPPETGVTPGNAAYLIYTSGSTGRPKGTVVSHRSLINLVHAQRDVLAPVTSDRVLQFASFSFDASLFELTWALANGARLCTAPRQSLRPGPDLEQALARYGVTAAVLPPTALQVMDPAQAGRLRTLVVAGEALPAETAAIWSGPTRLLNCYGLTETSVWVTAEQLAGGTGRPPIGRPIRNTQAYVLDRELRPVPVGVPGELFIGGVSVARGYLNQPGLTADRFVPDPFAGLPGSRLLRTGDIVRQLPGGALDYLGRADAQVKLGGYRIEPGEIESALRELPSVQAAAVLNRSGRLVAYVVPRPAQSGDASPQTELRRELGKRLPSYMLPSSFVFLAAMPLTSSEKIDRQALPDPARERPDLGPGYASPRTEAEAVLAGIWQDVLHVDRVGVHDDFFDLGGNSLSTVQVVIRSRTLGVEVTVRDLIENPTVAELACVVMGPGGGVVRARGDGGDGLVRVRLREGTGRPLYCVHPTGGSVTWYRPLAAALRAPRPVIGLQARGLSGGVDQVSIDELAADYVAEIKAHDDTLLASHGPRALLGWSMGASIAFEMARLISQIDPLILVEPALPSEATRRGLASVVALLEEARALRDAVRGLPAGSPAGTGPLHELRRVLRAAGLADEEVELGADAPIEVWHALLKVLATFRLGPCYVPVHLVVSDEFAGAAFPADGRIGYAEYLQTWQSVSAGGLTVHRVPGTHRTMLTEPLVHHIARIVESGMAGERVCES
jgi:amino acid adenylation domain-containing protein